MTQMLPMEAEICATVSFTDQAGTIAIEGGMGVGRVTKPGLGLNIGQAAIKLCTYEND